MLIRGRLYSLWDLSPWRLTQFASRLWAKPISPPCPAAQLSQLLRLPCVSAQLKPAAEARSARSSAVDPADLGRGCSLGSGTKVEKFC